MLHLKFLEKQEQAKPKTCRRKIIKIRAEISEIEPNTHTHTQNKNIQRINKTKSWFFENIDKIDKALDNVTELGGKRPKLVK
jgi:hypothetical protein